MSRLLQRVLVQGADEKRSKNVHLDTLSEHHNLQRSKKALNSGKAASFAWRGAREVQ